MAENESWPEIGQGMIRVRFTSGRLSGAVLDLPSYLSEVPPGRLMVTAGMVYDREQDYRPVRSARVLRSPRSTRSVCTPVVRADCL